jgi:hypothetical protein
MAVGAQWPTSHLSCLPSTGKMFLAGGYLQSVAILVSKRCRMSQNQLIYANLGARGCPLLLRIAC